MVVVLILIVVYLGLSYRLCGLYLCSLCYWSNCYLCLRVSDCCGVLGVIYE